MGISEGARRGRPPKITERDIVQAVLDEGFAGLTVPAVAERLGVTTMTLYRHTPTRAQLLALAWDHVLDSHAWPGHQQAWRELLFTHATALWDLLAAHPGAVTELSGAVLPPKMMHLYDHLAGALLDQGFTAAEAVLAVDSVIDLAIDHQRGVEDLQQPVDGEPGTLHERIGALWNPDAADHPQSGDVRAAMSQAIASEPRDWFIRKLDLVLDGIATRHGAST